MPKPTAPTRSYLPASALTPAPELSRIPMLTGVITHYGASRKPDHQEAAASLQQDLDALHRSFAQEGILEPLKVTLSQDKTTGIIWDGRHRHEWALSQDAAVPFEEVTRAEGLILIAATVAGRRHWTKGQRAWLAVQLNPQLLNNRTGPKSDASSSCETIASQFGVSLPLLEQAISIGKAFATVPTLRDRHEPGIWAGFGLGAILAGIPGGQATAGQPRAASTWVSLTKPYGTLTTLSKAFAEWSEDDRQAAQEATTNWLLKDCHPAYRTMLSEALAALPTK